MVRVLVTGTRGSRINTCTLTQVYVVTGTCSHKYEYLYSSLQVPVGKYLRMLAILLFPDLVPFVVDPASPPRGKSRCRLLIRM